MTYTTMTLDVADRIARVTLSRPDKLNTMNRAFWGEMVQVFAEIDERPDVRCVVLASTGKHFTAGLDLADFGGNLVQQDVEPARRAEQLRHVLEHGTSLQAVQRRDLARGKHEPEPEHGNGPAYPDLPELETDEAPTTAERPFGSDTEKEESDHSQHDRRDEHRSGR